MWIDSEGAQGDPESRFFVRQNWVNSANCNADAIFQKAALIKFVDQ
jgi:hypothetical protein